MSPMPTAVMPDLHVGDAAADVVDWITTNLSGLLDGISSVLQLLVDLVTDALLTLPALVLIGVLTLLMLLVRSWGMALFTLVGLLLVESMEMWDPAMETLGLVLVAAVIAVVIAIPVGILAARNDTVSAFVRPILDFMQTMPAFVYLVPVVLFFGIGVVAGVCATIIFALPPGVRLTELGIRQVDSETVEAGEAFGGTSGQILYGIQLPLGLPTIMAGVNQVIMLSLSMAVVAGLVGAGGLGGEVVTSISRLDVGLGFEAGISVVIVAIFLDRVTGAIGQPTGKSLLAKAKSYRPAPAGAA